MADINIESEIRGIFPVPVYKSNIGRNFTDEELQYVAKCESDCFENEHNKTSNNDVVLFHPSFKKVKDFISVLLADYYRKIIVPATSNDFRPVITQSWLNFTRENESHHPHAHPNSYVSGVLYIDADREYDSIEFFKRDYQRIQIDTDNHNEFNCSSFEISVGTGDIVMFPSELHHQVKVKKGNNLRTSLAFNTFVRGKIGTKYKLSQLSI
jgi:uncharacterized protein (TIGR02466 family)